LAGVDLHEMTCRDPDDLDRAREQLLNRVPSLDRPGPFSLLLAHTDDGDVIVVNLHHAAGDGLAALRLLGSIACAYAQEDDPVPEIDPLEVRDVRALTAPGSVKERFDRGRAALGYLSRGVRTPTRIAPQGANTQPGYGFSRLTFEAPEVERLSALRTRGATINDVLLGGLARTVNRWNEQHHADNRTIYLMMPMNLRPAAWRQDVVGNFASYVSVRIGSRDQRTLETAIQTTAARTRRIKDGGIAGLIIDLFGALTLLPISLKRRMQNLLPLTGNVLVDTAVLSNLGRIDSVPHLGDAGSVRELWFSPPGRMPLGASLGAATLHGRLFLTLRHRHALLDPTAANQFLATFKQELLAEHRA
jgi:NRPS condensation-like uncharacterized protein